jgi:hypothetical protein
VADLGVAAATVIPVAAVPASAAAAALESCTIALAPLARALREARRVLQERVDQAPVLLAVGNPLPLHAGWNPLGYRPA